MLLQIGAVESVVKDDIPANAVVCNVVVAYKDGHMDRMCWSGKPINKGLDKKRFRMECWATISQIARKGDWAFR